MTVSEYFRIEEEIHDIVCNNEWYNKSVSCSEYPDFELAKWYIQRMPIPNEHDEFVESLEYLMKFLIIDEEKAKRILVIICSYDFSSEIDKLTYEE